MISDVYRALWRHKVLIIVMTAVLVGATAVLTARQTKLYTASSLVRVQQNVRDSQEALGALMTGERLARTYEPVAETEAVRHLAKDRLQGKLPDDTFVVDAKQLSDLDLLNIAVTHRDPKVAAAGANAIPAALTNFIDKIDTFPDTITTVERAAPPTTPSSPHLRLRLVIALMLGLILGGGLALFREMLSDRIDGAEERARLTGHPVIATIPNLKLFPVPTIISVEPLQERQFAYVRWTENRNMEAVLPLGADCKLDTRALVTQRYRPCARGIWPRDGQAERALPPNPARVPGAARRGAIAGRRSEASGGGAGCVRRRRLRRCGKLRAVVPALPGSKGYA